MWRARILSVTNAVFHACRFEGRRSKDTLAAAFRARARDVPVSVRSAIAMVLSALVCCSRRRDAAAVGGDDRSRSPLRRHPAPTATPTSSPTTSQRSNRIHEGPPGRLNGNCVPNLAFDHLGPRTLSCCPNPGQVLIPERSSLADSFDSECPCMRSRPPRL